MRSLWNEGTAVSGGVQTARITPVIVNNSDSVSAVTAAAQKASPSVVTISATSAGAAGTGSGIVLDTAGHILTNAHVVTLDGQSASAVIEVRTSAGAVYSATVTGTDPLSDLAIIQVTADGLVPASLGDSDAVKVGDSAIAIGAPLGLSGTVTEGIVSAANRTIDIASSAASGLATGYSSTTPGSISLNVIQTDAAINPGNSGGALVNTHGDIIGVNVAIASAGSSGSAQTGNIGVGFSIPVNDAKRVAQEIIAAGSATHGKLGAAVRDSASSATSGFATGALITSVDPGSAAEKAGLKPGDVITKFGVRDVTAATELTAAVQELASASTATVTFQRGGAVQTADVVLG